MAEPIRSELFGIDRLEQHAASLADAQVVDANVPADHRVANRLRDNAHVLFDTYRVIAAAIREDRAITPAAEWLIDNFYVAQEQIREIRDDLPHSFYRGLPKLAQGPLKGYPRVFGVAWAFVAHTDSRFDAQLLCKFVRAYQRVTPLMIGELWAVAIALRITLVENLRRLADEIIGARMARQEADGFADRLLGVGNHESQEPDLTLRRPGKAPLSTAFAAQLIHRLRDQAPLATPALLWLDQRLAAQETNADEIVRAEHQKQSAMNVTVRNVFTSMRLISAVDWAEIFEDLSLVDDALRTDSDFAEMDFPSRDRYRHAIEELARGASISELEVARRAVDLAKSFKPAQPSDADAPVREQEPGYYLVSKGRRAFEKALGYRIPISKWAVRAGAATGILGYVVAIAFLVVFFVLLAVVGLVQFGISGWILGALALLALPSASDVAVALVNRRVAFDVGPTTLPALELRDGVPERLRTMLVMPMLMTSLPELENHIKRLEVHYLASQDGELHFALLSDWGDSVTEKTADDDELLAVAVEGIDRLNRQYGRAPGGARFLLLHRRRIWNESQGMWIGWERKRGKLHELNLLLRGATDTSFLQIGGRAPEVPSGVRYVITLDADTRLPRGTAKRLIGKMAHALNRPTFDPKSRRVVEGYAVLQPRVTPSFPSARQGSMFERVFTSPSGLDPYAFAVSDVYQDLFGEGSYIGKGIYDVDAFEKALKGRIPESTLLSHDLLEGIFARAGLLSDIEVVEEFPSRYDVAASRQHRWARGDWQLLPWIFGWGPEFGKGAIPLIGRWKMLDNLRRTLSAPAAFVALLAGWTLPASAAVFWTVFIVATFAIPPLLPAISGIFPRTLGISQRRHWRGVGADFALASLQIAFAMTLLAHQAWLMVDAIGRTLNRLYYSRRRLLEWTDAAALTSRTPLDVAGFYRRMAGGVALAVVAAIIVAFDEQAAWAIALPFVILWMLSPAIAEWMSLPKRVAHQQLPSPADSRALRLIARRTWRFFDTFVVANDHLLPPDNFQEDPSPVVAHRTSPTNLGLYLLSVVAARDFGWLGTIDTAERLRATMDTMEALERFRGHFYNWYGTLDVRPLEPRYLSSVDSGNLAAHLLALRNACDEILRAPVAGANWLAGVSDALEVARESLRALPQERRLQTVSRQHVEDALLDLAAIVNVPLIDETPMTFLGREAELVISADTIVDIARTLSAELSDDASAEVLAEAEALRAVVQSHLRDAEALMPWAYLIEADPAQPSLEALLGSVPSLAELPKRCEAALAILGRQADSALVETLERSAQAARLLIERVEAIATSAKALFDAMDFGLLFDPARQLLSVGYRCAEGALDQNCYDLLASEAHLASFVAIAKGDVPARHWYRLGRTVTPVDSGAALISWSGSMFEYLMPSLVLRAPADCLIDQSNRLAVRRQIEYATGLGLPWGMSESAFNARDLEMTYQYSSFGVPGLGLKRGLDDDDVIAPYATALAAMIDPHASARNFDRLAEAGGKGRYGFYEALDYTPERVPQGQKVAVVRSYMAHHQGMTLVAIDDVLHDGIMQDRFHAEPMVQATELLLQERAPRDVLVVHARPEHVKAAANVRESVPLMQRRFDSPHQPIPRTHILSNGSYAVMLTSSGAGYSRWRDLAVTRWREDTTCDNWGSFVFLRDATSGDVWSAGYQPTGREPETYEAEFFEDRAKIVRRDGAIVTTLEVTVSTEYDAEVRRVSISNLGGRTREIELTSYAEVVLAPSAADASHPAFSNLFVETEFIPNIGAIVATRRLRSPDDPQVWAVHLAVVEGDSVGGPQFETDRARFLGRGRGIRAAASVMDGRPLSNTAGAVLDPIFSVRRRLRLLPGATARVAFWTLVAPSRTEALDLADQHHDPAAFDRAATLAWTQAQVQLFHLGIDVDEANLFQRLAGHVLYSNPALRPSPEVLRRTEGGPPALWACGISGDLPIVLCRIDDIEDLEIVRQLLRAHEYWRMKQLVVDLVILNERSPSYSQDLLSALDTIVRASQVRQLAGGHATHGTISVLRAELISAQTRNALRGAARAILLSRSGSLFEQVGRLEEAEPAPGRARVRLPASEARAEVLLRPNLEYFNGLGGFSDDGREYVTYLGDGQWTPAPWINVIANPSFGFQVSTEGAGYAWSINSQRNQLTPWSNDPVSDRPGEALYVRDEDSGALWSPTAQPIREDSSPYVARHGQGYSRFEHVSHGISLELTQFVPRSGSVKISRLKIRNQSGRTRRLSITSYVEWVMGTSRAGSAPFVVTDIDPGTKAMFATNLWNTEFGTRTGFADLSGRQRSWTGDRTEFLGRDGSLDRPAALDRGLPLSNRVGAGLDPCGALQTRIELAPNGLTEVVFLLGDAASKEEALALVARYRTEDLDAVLAAVTRFWDDTLGAIQVRTPDRSMDVLLNRWLMYQTLACRIWARTGFYQASGAYGFRDQLQDVMSVCASRPDVTREHLLRAAARQFVEGDVQHWWHTPTGQGVRTRISDDRIWLPFAVAHYIDVTGDAAVLDELVPFLEGPVLRDEEHESYFQPNVGAQPAPLYEHCARALDRSLDVGGHGLPLMGGGDWNDGMNRVGIEGKGESIWLGWFLHAAIASFAPLAGQRGDATRADAWRTHAAAMKKALEDRGWDGAWYRRAFFDDGSPLGSSSSEECQIDSIAQSWAVISGAADPKRAAAAMVATDERLVSRDHALVRLFTPPFDKTPLDPGYIKAYPPGVRENGGQYTHGALWTVIAFAMLGDGDKAAELFSLLNPINHSSSRAAIYRYKVEPYVACADVYDESAHVGRGGWTWYTGSAGWMYRAGIEWILGIRQHGGGSLSIDPRIPKAWQSFSVTFKHRSATYDITVDNPRGVSFGVTGVEVDGRSLDSVGPFALVDDGATHRVKVVLG